MNRLVSKEAGEVVGEFLRSAVTFRRLLFQTFQADGFQVGGNGRIEFARSSWFSVLHGAQSLRDRRANERWPSGEKLVNDRAESIDVRGHGGLTRTAHRNLRRQISGCADQGLAYGQGRIFIGLPRKTEVAHMRLVFVVEEDIGWFQVPVQYAALMRVINGLCDLDQNSGEMTVGRGIGHSPRDQLLDRCSFDQLHAVKAEAITFPDFIDRHDVWMVEARRGAGLQAETFPSMRARQVRRRDGLQRHQTPEATLARAIHHALAAAAQFAEKFVVAKNWRRRDSFRGFARVG